MALLMENKDLLQPQVLTNPELPSLLQYIESKTVDGFDSVEGGNGPQGDPKAGKVSNATKVHSVDMPRLQSPVQTTEGHQPYSLSFSLPASPSGLHIAQARKILICDQSGPTATDVQPNGPSESSAVDPQQPKQAKFHSQPIAAVNSYSKAAAGGKVPDPVENQGWVPANDVMRDARFDPFKTWSGGLERQLSNLRGRPQPGPDVEANGTQISEIEALPAVERYFDALEGPELDTLRASEVSVLPEDEKWPFLLRFPISSFGMCLGVSSQAILWKKLATSPSTSFLHVSPNVNLVLWCISLALMGIVSLIYSLKIIFFFEAVRREYYHPVRVNFFFAPWIACLFLVLGVPPSIAERQPAALWYVLMAPIFCLDLKIYGQWMSGGRRRLSKVANPSNHLAIVGNFVGALLGASMGLKEGPIFFFAVGLAHYTVLFVTLYQRLPTTTTLPKELHPVFFLFVATPSVACMAWAQIRSDFDYGARIVYFIALFLYLSLAVRVNFFRGFRFSLAWWAYTFPTTGASVATIRYADEVTSAFSRSLAVSLSAISTFAVGTLLVTTIIHAFVLRDLFPNDVSIAITQKRPKFSRKLARLISPGSSDLKDREASIGRDSPSP